MANITSVWISFSDANGSEALEIFQISQDLKNAVPPIKVESIAFYSKDEKGISTRLETQLPNGDLLITK